MSDPDTGHRLHAVAVSNCVGVSKSIAVSTSGTNEFPGQLFAALVLVIYSAALAVDCVAVYVPETQTGNNWIYTQHAVSAIESATAKSGSVLGNYAVSDAHWHHDVLVVVVAIFGRMKLRLGITIFEFKRDFGIANHV